MEDARPKPFSLTDDLVLATLRQAASLHEEGQAAPARRAGDPPADPVLAKLRQAEELYLQFQERWERQLAQLMAAQTQLANLEEANAQLTHALTAGRRQLEQERERAQRQQERANHTAALLRDIHRAALGGNVYDLILRTCLTLTGGTRGLYVSARRAGDPLRVRAAIDVEGYPAAAPSPFVEAMCRKVLAERDTLVSSEDDAATLPQPDSPSEHFHNYLAARVVMLDQVNGVIVAGDKLRGDFEEDDADTLLSIGEQTAVAAARAEHHGGLLQAYGGTIARLAGAMASGDLYAPGEALLAARLARQVAERLALPEEERAAACYGALLRDIGLAGIADGVLRKPGPLLPPERELVRLHARLGHDLLAAVPGLQPVAEVVLRHHEWHDGGGYPDGLAGEAIPLAARIVGAVDAYCAMTARRSYREAYGEERARAELSACAGSQFDPRVVAALLDVLDQPGARDPADVEAAWCGTLPGFHDPEDAH